MTSSNLDIRIKAVFQRAIHVSGERLSDETRRGQLEEWDSLGHLMIVQGVAEEFNVDIAPEEALNMETVKDIKHFLQAAGAV